MYNIYRFIFAQLAKHPTYFFFFLFIFVYELNIASDTGWFFATFAQKEAIKCYGNNVSNSNKHI